MAASGWTLFLLLVAITRGQGAAINKRPVTGIQPIKCWNKVAQEGVCMFAFHCLLFKGTYLTTCYDGIFVGSCCQLPYSSGTGPSNEVLPLPVTQQPDAIVTTTTTTTSTMRPEVSPSTPAAATLDWRPVTSTSFVTSIPDDIESGSSEESQYAIETSTDSTTSEQFGTEHFTTDTVPEDIPETTDLVTRDMSPVTPPSVSVPSQHTAEEQTATVFTTVPTTTTRVRTPLPTTTPFVTTTPVPTTTSTTVKPFTSTSKPKPFTSTSKPKPIEVVELSTLAPNKTVEGMENYKEVCGRPRLGPKGRIVGGTNADYAEWPWMISLRQWKKNAFMHKCGAALLNGVWAVTAAHCVDSVPPGDILLRLGEYDVNSNKESEPYEERRVQIVAAHPKFDPRTFEYDLALLRFYEKVPFRRNILPICIPHGNNLFVGSTATVTGWGRLYEDGPLPGVMQEVQVPVITNSECESMYKKAGFVEDIPDIFICAGKPDGGKDSCEGDSGGPMVLKDGEGKWVLAGIISWGIGCAMPNQPGVYTRITKFANWIEQIIAF